VNSGVWEWWGSKPAIENIEREDIGFLVQNGLGVLRSDGDRCRVYEIYLAPGMPNHLKDRDRCKLRFWYGSQTGKAKMWCKRAEFEALSHFLLGANGNGHKPGRCWQ
jgi:hypothetical protein